MEVKTFSLDDNRCYVYDLVKLRARHAWFLLNNTQLAFEEIVSKRVKFYANAFRESDDQWENWVAACYEKYKSHGDNPDTDALEEWVLEQEKPFIEKNLEAEYQKQWLAPLQHPFHGFSYEFHPSYDDPDSEDFLTLHFRNNFWPDSPFHHIPELKKGLSELVAQAVKERPDVIGIQCCSWLNSVKPFADLFPAEWRQSATPRPEKGHMGWWGQFMDRKGNLHKKNAEILRKTGTFPFQHCRCHCLIDEFRK